MIQTWWKITKRMCLANGMVVCVQESKRHTWVMFATVLRAVFLIPNELISLINVSRQVTLLCRFTRLEQKCHKWPGSTLLQSALQTELPLRSVPQGSPLQHRLLLGRRDNALCIRQPNMSTNMLPLWCQEFGWRSCQRKPERRKHLQNVQPSNSAPRSPQTIDCETPSWSRGLYCYPHGAHGFWRPQTQATVVHTHQRTHRHSSEHHTTRRLGRTKLQQTPKSRLQAQGRKSHSTAVLAQSFSSGRILARGARPARQQQMRLADAYAGSPYSPLPCILLRLSGYAAQLKLLFWKRHLYGKPWALQHRAARPSQHMQGRQTCTKPPCS